MNATRINYLKLSAIGILALSPMSHADDGYGPNGSQHAPSKYVAPKELVAGGAFIDHILPMPMKHPLRSDVWGGPNVKPRMVENGLEDADWSYWCMSVHREADGKYHLFATRWPEGDPRGHNAWPASEVVHTVADDPMGPYRVQSVVGPGHNVMAYRPKDGTYMLYVINGAYHAKTLAGPWEKYDLKYDNRGTKGVAMSNHTYVSREDGSVLMVSRGGHVWISEDGLKPFRKITTESFYPKIPGAFEDPVVWKDANQYHCIVNDWHGRTAFYLRSGNGVDWVWDQGKAYDIEVVKHADGTKEGWHKFERPNVLQDAHGRATQIFFAVMDAPKDLDKGKDAHSSKVLTLPLRVEKRMEWLSGNRAPQKGETVKVKLLAEDGFDPIKDLDAAQLQFGVPAMVNTGRGAKCEKVEASGKDVILTFAWQDELPAGECCARVLGKMKNGELVHGYVRVPGRGLEPLLSPLPPVIQANGELAMVVENFDVKNVQACELPVECIRADGQKQSLMLNIPELAAYGQAKVSAKIDPAWLVAGQDLKVVVHPASPALKVEFTIKPQP